MQGATTPESANRSEGVVEELIADVEEAPELDEAWDQVWDKVDGWLESLVKLLPNLVVAVLLIVAFWLASLVVKRVVRRVLRPTPITPPVTGLLVLLVSLIINATGVFVALGILGLDKTVTSLLAGVGILGIALGFAFQDIATNFIAGVLLSFRRPARIGDLVEMDGHTGTVTDINLRSTLLDMPNGETVYIPNKRVFENVIVNYSRLGRRRVDVGVGVSYDDDLEKVESLAREVVGGLQAAVSDRPVEVFFREFGDSSINLVVRFWVEFEGVKDELAAESAAIKAIKRAFDGAGISIPFPIRTLDLSAAPELPFGQRPTPES